MKSLDEIAQALQGFDPQALSVDKAQEFIQHLVQALPPVAAEELPLMQALGRIVAEDIISPIHVPAHDNSAMDGFAFDGKQLGLTPLKLRVVGTALAGKAWQGNVKTGECVKIMTGAVMPTGLDTVIAQPSIPLAMKRSWRFPQVFSKRATTDAKPAKTCNADFQLCAWAAPSALRH